MRVYNVSHLANRSLAGDVARGHNAVTSIIDAYDAKKRSKVLQQRADEDYASSKERQKTLQGREDTLYNQQQQDRELRLEQGSEDRERRHASEDAAEARALNQDERLNRQEGRLDEQAIRQRDAHLQQQRLNNMIIESKKANQPIEIQKRNIERMKLEQEKETINREKVYGEFQSLYAMIENNESPEKINASIAKAAKMSGMDLTTIDADSQLVKGLQDHLGNNGKLDDPKMLPALKAIWKSRSAADGRGDKYNLIGMLRTPEGDYIPQLEYADGSGKVSHQTYGKSSDPDDILQKFSRPEIMGMATAYDKLAKEVSNISKSYGMVKEPEQKDLIKVDNALYDPNTNQEVYRNDGGTGGGQSGTPQSKAAEIMANKYESEGDATGSLINNELSQFGIHSERMVEKVRREAEKKGVEPIEMAAQIGQSEYNRKRVPEMTQDLIESNPELEAIKDEIQPMMEKHFKKNGATIDSALAKVEARFEKYKKREEKRAERKARKAKRDKAREAIKNRPKRKIYEANETPSRINMYRNASKKLQERLNNTNAE